MDLPGEEVTTVLVLPAVAVVAEEPAEAAVDGTAARDPTATTA